MCGRTCFSNFKINESLKNNTIFLGRDCFKLQKIVMDQFKTNCMGRFFVIHTILDTSIKLHLDDDPNSGFETYFFNGCSLKKKGKNSIAVISTKE